jgi:hypothetical protein
MLINSDTGTECVAHSIRGLANLRAELFQLPQDQLVIGVKPPSGLRSAESL